MRDYLLGLYLRAKIEDHINRVLDEYIDNPDDIKLAVWDIMEAIEKEMVWYESSST